MAEYDSPWKESLEIYFQPFMALCFPAVHEAIDWARGYLPMDKELQKISPTGATGPRTVDKLIRVWLTTGEEKWILIHVEVQSQSEAGFEKRMFVYHYRLLDRYNKRVVSLAVLGDDQPGWHPDRYQHGLCGCELEFRFPTVKLLDYADRVEELEKSDNPFAIFVLAHLKGQETREVPLNRLAWKFRLTKGLFQHGRSADQIRSLFRFIDWMIDLPLELEEKFSEQLSQFEEEQQMPYVTSIERLGIEKGIKNAIEMVLEARFGASAVSVMSEIRQLSDAELLEKILRQASTVDRLEDLAGLWDPPESHATDRQEGE